jgi:hypothetical protein
VDRLKVLDPKRPIREADIKRDNVDLDQRRARAIIQRLNSLQIFRGF